MKSDFVMKHLNPYRFYELAAKLHALFSNSSNRVTDMFAPITAAQAMLDGWIKGDPYSLETSQGDANRLLSKISNLFNKYYIDQNTKQLKHPTGEDRIDAHELALLYSMLEKFEHALAAELTYAPTFVAGKCGIYSTYDLIENAYQNFSQTLRDNMPESSMREFDTAGRALAFGLGTAAGLHLLRAVELVLKRYYETFSGTTVSKTERTYAIYLKKLAVLAEEDANGFRPDKRLLQMLAQIKEHYRNPLTNPETNITVEQATALFGLGAAAMTLMTEQVMEYQARKAGAAIETDDEVVEEPSDDQATRKAEAALTDVTDVAKEDGVVEVKSKKSKAG